MAMSEPQETGKEQSGGPTVQLDPRQLPWEGIATHTMFTAIYAGGMLWLHYYQGVPFEALVLVALAVIASETGALWRVICR